jgi:hypothetical protein
MQYINTHYIFNRAGKYYFCIRIPTVLKHYSKCPKVIIFLRTLALKAFMAQTANLSGL